MKFKDSIFIGLDLSLTNSGICILEGTESKLFQVPTKLKDFTHTEQRVRYIAMEVIRKIKEHIDKSKYKQIICGVEDYAMNARVGKTLDRAEVGGVVKQAIWNLTGKPPFKMNNKTMKVFLTGKGNVQKSHHLMYAFEKYRIKFPNDDVCDAFVVAKLLQALFRKPEGLFKYERDSVKATIKYASNGAKLIETGLWELVPHKGEAK